MKLRVTNRTTAALTRVEVLAVILVLFVLAALFLPALLAAKMRGQGSHINCVNNVKQVALSFRVWAIDNQDKYPMEISIANGGTSELAAKGDVVATFQIISNELSTPKVLICPEDTGHIFATNFSGAFSAKNISYFIGVNASTNLPRAFLSGDDHFSINATPVSPGLFDVVSNTPVAWNSSRHVAVGTHFWFFSTKASFGNVGFGDGGVQQLNNSDLLDQVRQTGVATNRLAIP
jgi:competence protein ComGC